MDEYMNEWMDECPNELEWAHEWIDEYQDVGEWAHEWMDECPNEPTYQLVLERTWQLLRATEHSPLLNLKLNKNSVKGIINVFSSRISLSYLRHCPLNLSLV